MLLQPAETDPSSVAQIDGGTIAIASPSAIDEACYSAPAIRAIHNAYPNGTIVVFAQEELAPLWRKVRGVARVISYPPSTTGRKLTNTVMECGIDFTKAIMWEPNAASEAFARAGIPMRMGPPEEGLKEYLTHPVEVKRPPGPIEHRVRHYLFAMQKLGAMPFDKANFVCPERPIPLEKIRIAIVPGSDFGNSAEWSVENYVTLTSTLLNYADITIIGSPDRTGPAMTLGKALGKPELVYGNEGDELLNHLATCHGLVGNDGSIPHLASHMGTPCLVLFGPNEPEWKRPLGRIHRFIRHHVPCSGCLLAKCPFDHRCMKEITVEEVIDEMRELFG